MGFTYKELGFTEDGDRDVTIIRSGRWMDRLNAWRASKGMGGVKHRYLRGGLYVEITIDYYELREYYALGI